MTPHLVARRTGHSTHDRRDRTKTLSRAASFWLLVGLLAAFLFAASAPSPLYAVY